MIFIHHQAGELSHVDIIGEDIRLVYPTYHLGAYAPHYPVPAVIVRWQQDADGLYCVEYRQSNGLPENRGLPLDWAHSQERR